ncbi:hypothetical protein EI71_00942 [Anaeroplasma bactoclasticum]|jgi:hypothetical protein|uniref:Uncharacterized protein n=1 Tax=Anaeroplasma bactoclasticum TaxID=2088 RepID=A0A397RVQ2_9MOLU|nr:hypothetical protein [Anaeroplasma bactoclasticum]RIA77788.1 hypothetical protein EI71_00942 [Anaeroplasma bactoclasticum]
MILKYDEALEKAENKDWFKSFYKREDLASDSEVNQINTLVKELGEDVLFDYFEIKEDMVLQKEYVLDLLDYLEDVNRVE